MLTYDDALNMNYYKKTSFTGWMGSLRFKIAMDTDENDAKRFHVWIWPAPYNFVTTPDDQKQEAFFPFTEEGRKQSVDWVNANINKYQER